MTQCNESERCTCLTMTQLAQMQARNEVVQSRHPCPVHGEPEWPEGMFIERAPVCAACGDGPYARDCQFCGGTGRVPIPGDSMSNDSAVPGQITIYVCDSCGRKGFSTLDVRTGHWARGKRCGGTVVKCSYIYESEETTALPGFQAGEKP